MTERNLNPPSSFETLSVAAGDFSDTPGCLVPLIGICGEIVSQQFKLLPLGFIACATGETFSHYQVWPRIIDWLTEE